MKLSKEQLNIACLSLAVRMDNHNDIESVLVNAGLIRKWIKK